VLGDEPLGVQHGRGQQRPDPGGQHPATVPHGAQPQHRHERRGDPGAQPQLAGQHEQPEHGEAVDLLVEPYPGQCRRDDDEGQGGRRAQ
jgi:hypothetical protein